MNDMALDIHEMYSVEAADILTPLSSHWEGYSCWAGEEILSYVEAKCSLRYQGIT
jgi:hypothetical protein